MSTRRRYIVAVSGGIDSMVLLDMIMHPERSQAIGCGADAEYIVAHVDHGIRKDSHEDALLVRGVAAHYGVKYESITLNLGPGVSEEAARSERYAWLRELQDQHQADAIITAHHQDDVLETMIINLVRGTGWRGLSSLRSHPTLLRPLLLLSKAEIIRYALEHAISWREDETNDDVRYLRNYIRQLLIPRLTPPQRRGLIDLYKSQVNITAQIDDEVGRVATLCIKEGVISRYMLAMIAPEVAHEIIAYWCECRLEQRTLERIRHFILTAKPHKQLCEGAMNFRATAQGAIVSLSDI